MRSISDSLVDLIYSQERRTPRYTTRIDELPTVKA